MRVEYNFALNEVEVPTFSVESMEGPEKLFRLVTLVLNVLGARPRVEIIFHSPNQADLPKKISAFQKIMASAPSCPKLRFEEGSAGSMGSSYYTWVTIHAG